MESSASSDSSAGIRDARHPHKGEAVFRAAMNIPAELSSDEQREDELQATSSPVIRSRATVREDSISLSLMSAESSATTPHQSEQRQHAMRLRAEPLPLRERTMQSDVVSTQEPEGCGSRDRRGVFDNHGIGPTPLAISKRGESRSSSSAANDSQAMQAPAVRITIGRIDVRAELTEPPAPVAPRRFRTGTLSLDQYLTQRSETRR